MGVLTRFSDVRLAGVALLSKRAQGGTGKRIEGVKRGVPGPTDLARRCCFVAFAVALSSCANLSDTLEVSPFLGEQITGDTWRACLAREYQLQGRSEVRSGRRWAGATHLSAKGRSALAGAEVGPEPALSDASLIAARARLDAALVNRPRKPCECAQAQASYDGWLVKAARGADTSATEKRFGTAVEACATSR